MEQKPIYLILAMLTCFGIPYVYWLYTDTQGAIDFGLFCLVCNGLYLAYLAFFE